MTSSRQYNRARRMIMCFISAAAMVLTSANAADQQAGRQIVKPQLPSAPVRFEDHVSGVSFITADLAATLRFYTRFAGLVQPRPQRLLTDAPSLAVYGVTDGTPIPYASLVPKGWPQTYPGHPGLNFAEIKSDKALLTGAPKRAPQAGETVLAFSVRNLTEKAEMMAQTGVKIVVPLALSGTGRSKAITVLDPNGVRVQLYEFIK